MKKINKILIMIIVWVWYKLKSLIKSNKREFSNILILDLMGIGDVVCLTPFIERLKESGQFNKITACFSNIATDLSKSFVSVDDYIYHKDYKSTIKAIRQANFDLIIIPGWGLKHTIIALLSRASLIGFLHDLTFSNRYINSFKLQTLGAKPSSLSQKWTDMGRVHLSQRPNSILEYFSLKPISNILEIDYTELKDTQENYAVFHCSADFEGRQWDLQRFRELAEKMLDLSMVEKIYLIGADYDAPKYEVITSDYILNVAGKMNLLETKELISKAKMFVGNDSGPMHIATFSRIPTYALMGPNLPIISGTISSIGHNFFHKQACCPCNQRGCPYGYKCIKAISVEEVLNHIIKDYKVYYE